MKRLAVLAAALGLLPLSAHAAKLTYDITTNRETPAFDPSLGTLIGVSVIETLDVKLSTGFFNFTSTPIDVLALADFHSGIESYATDGGATGQLAGGPPGLPGQTQSAPPGGSEIIFPEQFEDLHFFALPPGPQPFVGFLQSATTTTVDFDLQPITWNVSYDPFNVAALPTVEQFAVSKVVVEYDYRPAVPEPAAWLLMLTGFGLSGAALRRRPRLPA